MTTAIALETEADPLATLLRTLDGHAGLDVPRYVVQVRGAYPDDHPRLP